jgi:FKBP-type peptidyl-prolyl cis-trans isomerase
MKSLSSFSLISVCVFAAACGGPDPEPQQDAPATETAAPAPDPLPTDGARDAAGGEAVQIAPGLHRRILEEGDGATAEAGQTAVVHYTGWLHDESAPGNRGEKFDSSRDRGQYFEFPLGAGRVIRGWDQGVVGMEVGEVRELTIAPELAYGERGAGELIPPNATLVFEVELVDLKEGP